MKKIGFLSVFILTFFVANATVFAYDGEKPKYQLLLSLAAGYAKNKDMDNSAKKSVQNYKKYLNSQTPAYTNFSENDTKANLPVGFDLDFRYFFSNFGFGLQVGYYLEKAESELSASGGAGNLPVKATQTVEK